MIAFDLVCRAGAHRFEGWFGSSDDFEQQKLGGLLSCPVCGDVAVDKAVMAPNVGRKGNQASTARRSADGEESVAVANMPEMPAEMVEMIGRIAEMQSKMLEKSDWVGDRFADEARAIHYGDAPDRTIHGSTTIDDARELHDEGIAVAPLPLPFVPPEAKN
ncbi:DUF1178 family protein [Sphingorhabdus sp.]|jgi:hypothetical protein|uniref:DUF1178 family protein n=1 Tax=Sphingorhabdus sp. TaxID=1902408 RepID=UPI0035B0A966|nr:DUF1178 family protein [Sphingomonadaceae bacterium]